MRISQQVKGVKMRILRGTIFNMTTKVLQDFHICMSVPLKNQAGFLSQGPHFHKAPAEC